MNTLQKNGDLHSLIFEFRGMRVMVDSDLAVLYDTETKRLKQQVKRNAERFPEDFMFELTYEEKEQLIYSCSRLQVLKHSSVGPMVFTEQGVAMLSSILSSKKAISINIEIMRAFVQYRKLISESKELKEDIVALDEKLNQSFRYLLERIDALSPRYTKRKMIGFKRGKKVP